MSKAQTITSWILQLIAAAILFQTLFFKFTGAEESRYIFSKLGLEPWGRIGSGVVELVAVVLLLIPKTAPLGALLSLGVISGAIVSHVAKLGIVVRNDGGLLFALAIVVFVCSVLVLMIRRRELVRLLLTPCTVVSANAQSITEPQNISHEHDRRIQ